MKHHFVYASSYENKVLEIDTDEEPPRVGDYIQLPFGENKEMCRYRVVDVYYATGDPGPTTYYIEVKPV
jgi:hypothetical protein